MNTLLKEFSDQDPQLAAHAKAFADSDAIFQEATAADRELKECHGRLNEPNYEQERKRLLAEDAAAQETDGKDYRPEIDKLDAVQNNRRVAFYKAWLALRHALVQADHPCGMMMHANGHLRDTIHFVEKNTGPNRAYRPGEDELAQDAVLEKHKRRPIIERARLVETLRINVVIVEKRLNEFRRMNVRFSELEEKVAKYQGHFSRALRVVYDGAHWPIRGQEKAWCANWREAGVE